MNTLQTPGPIDLYEQERRDVELDDLSMDSIRAKFNAAKGVPAPTDPTISATDIPQVMAPSNPEEMGTPPSAAFEAEMEKKSTFDKIMDGVEFVTSPLVALADASLAPLAHEYEEEGLVGQIGEAFGVSGDAFIGRLLPKYGEDHELYGQDIVENVMPNAPDAVKAAAATTLELIADPTIAVGLPAAKVVQRGLKIASETKGPFKGIYTEGIHELLTMGKGTVAPGDLDDIGRLAAKADAGDQQAIGELHEMLESNDVIQEAVQRADDADVADAIMKMEDIVGSPAGEAFTVKKVKTPDPKALLKDSLTTNNPTHAININLSKMNSEDDLDNLLLNSADFYKKQFNKARGKQTNAETALLAKDQHQQLTDLLGRKASQFKPEEAYALRQILSSSAENLQKLAIKADMTNNDLDLLAFNKAVTVHQAIQAKATGVAGHAGRLLQQYNMVSDSSRGFIRQVNSAIVEAGENPYMKTLLKKMVASTGDAGQLNKLLNKSPMAKTADALFEVYVNAILSGPATHLVNITSNALMIGMRPSEKFLQGLSAAVRLDFKQASSNLHEGAAMMHGVSQGIGDALRLMTNKESISSLGLPEDVVKSHELAKLQGKRAISSAELGGQGKLGAAVDALGTFIRLPGAALLKEDVMFKAIHNRIEINAIAARKAATAGADSNTTRQIYNAMRANPDQNMRNSAKNMMEYYTFTNKLGTAGTKVHQGIQATPMKIMVPFFRTPMNIIKVGVRHTVFGNVFKDLKDIGKTGAIGDKARARVALGTLIPGTIVGMLDDNISGAVDTSTPSGRFQAENGVPPYSIKVGDQWVSYERLEPIRTILGLYVNYREAIQNIETTDPETGEPTNMAEELFSAAVAPMIKTVGDNYMLSTTGHVVYLLESIQSGNTDYIQKTFAKMASSATPYSGMGRQTSRVVDPTFRQAETYIEQMKTVIPGLSKTLPARQTVWGDDQLVVDGHSIESMSPIKTRTVKTDKLDEELIALEVNIPGQPKSMTFNGIELELNPMQQEQFMKMRGKGVEGAPPLKDTMRMMSEDPSFQALPPEMKKERYEWMFNQATEMTKKYMFSADPSLQMLFHNRVQAKQKLLQGTTP